MTGAREGAGFLTAKDGGNAENAGAIFRLTTMNGGLSRASMAFEGRSRPSMVSAALGLLPGALGLLPVGNAGNAGAISGRLRVRASPLDTSQFLSR